MLPLKIFIAVFMLRVANMAEFNKPVKDWELCCLAERMSPTEFDQIAIRFLGLTKVYDIC